MCRGLPSKTSKYGVYGDSNNGVTITKLKITWNKYKKLNNENSQQFWNNGTYCYLERSNSKILNFFYK